MTDCCCGGNDCCGQECYGFPDRLFAKFISPCQVIRFPICKEEFLCCGIQGPFFCNVDNDCTKCSFEFPGPSPFLGGACVMWVGKFCGVIPAVMMEGGWDCSGFADPNFCFSVAHARLEQDCSQVLTWVNGCGLAGGPLPGDPFPYDRFCVLGNEPHLVTDVSSPPLTDFEISLDTTSVILGLLKISDRPFPGDGDNASMWDTCSPPAPPGDPERIVMIL